MKIIKQTTYFDETTKDKKKTVEETICCDVNKYYGNLMVKLLNTKSYGNSSLDFFILSEEETETGEPNVCR